MKHAILALILAASSVTTVAAERECHRETFSARERHRYDALVSQLRDAVLERRELPDGWSFHVRARGGNVAKLGEWMQLERRCCSFFDFALEWKSGDADPWVTVRGPGEAKAILGKAWSVPR